MRAAWLRPVLLLALGLALTAAERSAELYLSGADDYTLFVRGYTWRAIGPAAVLDLGGDAGAVPLHATDLEDGRDGRLFEFRLAPALAAEARVMVMVAVGEGRFGLLVPLAEAQRAPAPEPDGAVPADP